MHMNWLHCFWGVGATAGMLHETPDRFGSAASGAIPVMLAASELLNRRLAGWRTRSLCHFVESNQIGGVVGVGIFIRRIYLLGVVFILMGGLTTVLGLRNLEEQLRRAIESTITFKLDSAMGEISAEMLTVDRIINAAETVIAMETDEAQTVRFFHEVLAHNSSFLAMYLGIGEGHVLYSNREVAWDPNDPTVRPWYQAATRAGTAIYTPPYVDVATNRPVLTRAKPLYDQNGQLTGVLGVDRSLEGMLATLDGAKPSENGQAFAFDRTTQTLIGSEQVHPEGELTSRLLAEPHGIFFTDLGGQDGYLKWQAVGASDMVLGLFAPTKDFLDYRVVIMEVLRTALLSLTLLSLVLVWFQHRFITGPMLQLDRDMMAISLDEDVTYRVPTRDKDPFAPLRAAINTALDDAQAYFDSVVYQQEELTAAYRQLVANEDQLREQYQEIKEHEDHIQFLADHDVLTGLPNRRRFQKDLDASLDAGKTGSVFFLDIDRFKNVNDTLGHVYGDTVLRRLARALKRNQDPKSAAYRFAGDEFLVVVEGVVEPEELRPIVDELFQNLSEVQAIEGRHNRITASMGVVRYPQDGTSVEELLVKAEIAMYSAKQGGRNRCHLFEGSMSMNFEERVYMEQILRKAVRTNGFRLCYQPIVDASTGEITCFEALIRLDGHDLSPAVFIGIAEESNLIQPIGRWVIKTAIEQLVAWEKSGAVVKPISINLSPRQFYDDGLVGFLIEMLALHDVSPNFIQMEITETVLIDNAKAAVRIIERLRVLGVRIALDDFGTGYLSMQYITDIPVDQIKLDVTMTRGLPETLPVMEGLITIAHGLGMDVVVEGVERIEQAQYAVQACCDYLQGYLFARPMPADQGKLELNRDYFEFLQPGRSGQG